MSVPLAHFTIIESGPSGRRGCDGDQVLNIRAVGFGHSDLFSIDKRLGNGLTYLAPLLDFAELTAVGLILLLTCAVFVGFWRNRRRKGS
jgi:hypothetical protein